MVNNAQMLSADVPSLARVAGFAAAGYVLLLTLIRLSGPRTISKMNPSDFAITVALGSTIATLVLSKDVALLEGAVALVVLVALQVGTERVSRRSVPVRTLLEGTPTLLLYQGRIIQPALHREHVTETALFRAIREHGLSDLERVHAVVLEVDGTFSVIPGREGLTESALDDVERPQNEGAGRTPGK